MKTSRRAFIKSAAALPAAGAVANLGLGETAKAAAPPPPTPYTDHPWQWFVSHDGETYHEAFKTMAEAVEYAKRCEYSVVAECKQQDFSLSVEGYNILELLDGQNEEARGDGEGIECTDEQEKDLGEMVTAAIEAWAVKHKISLLAWAFAATRNQIEVSPPDDSARGAA